MTSELKNISVFSWSLRIREAYERASDVLETSAIANTDKNYLKLLKKEIGSDLNISNVKILFDEDHIFIMDSENNEIKVFAPWDDFSKNNPKHNDQTSIEDYVKKLVCDRCDLIISKSNNEIDNLQRKTSDYEKKITKSIDLKNKVFGLDKIKSVN